MRTTIAAATVAASVAVGGIAGAVFGTPVTVGASETAAETATGAVSWISEALGGLVSDDTITREQADAVEAALAQARPERGGHHRGWHVGLSVAAEAIGLTEDELRGRLAGGETIADVADGESVDVQSVIDALVAAQTARLDAKVADGELTQAEADERLADAEERITAMVNSDTPAFGRGGPGRGRGQRGAPSDSADADDA